MRFRWVYLAFVVFLATASFADSQSRIVRLSYVEGDVQIDRAMKRGLERAILNMPVTDDTRLNTGDDGATEVEFENGSTIRLAPKSEVYFEQLALLGTGGKVNTTVVEEGLIYIDFRAKDEDEVRVVAGNRQFRIEDRVRLRIDARRDKVEVAVMSGEASLIADDGSRVVIRKNETLTLDLEDAGRYFLAKGVLENSWDEWDKEREKHHTTYEQARRYVSSPYEYGFSDLHHYGQYTYVSGYGYVWRPWGVDFGWDPYRDGAWVWYPRHGYVWVSAYPWGWTPYRHGRWLHLSFGWVWQPGYWGRWHRTVHFYNPPRHYRHPRPPRYTRHIVPTRPVVWVGSPTRRPQGPTLGDRFGRRRPADPAGGVRLPSFGDSTARPRPADRDLSGRRPTNPVDSPTQDRVGVTPGGGQARRPYKGDLSGRRPTSPVDSPAPDRVGETPGEQGRRPVNGDLSGRRPARPADETPTRDRVGVTPRDDQGRRPYEGDLSGRRPARPADENPTRDRVGVTPREDQGRRPYEGDLSGRRPTRPADETSNSGGSTVGVTPPAREQPRPVERDISGRRPVSPAERPDFDGQTGRTPARPDGQEQPRPRFGDGGGRPAPPRDVAPPSPQREARPPAPSRESRPPAPSREVRQPEPSQGGGFSRPSGGSVSNPGMGSNPGPGAAGGSSGRSSSGSKGISGGVRP